MRGGAITPKNYSHSVWKASLRCLDRRQDQPVDDEEELGVGVLDEDEEEIIWKWCIVHIATGCRSRPIKVIAH